MNWMAILFLISVSLLAVDIITGFGFLLPRLTPSLRGLALVIGGVLSVIAIIQGMRPPVVQKYEVSISNFPEEMDGKVLVAISDLHLGSLIGKRWMEARVAQVQALNPDIIVLLGDIFEGHGQRQEDLVSVFRRLSAPLGVWAILGNHESYDRSNVSTSILEGAGIKILVNSWTEVRPGFVLAGVYDRSFLRTSGQGVDLISKTLEGHPPGATILLSHKPIQADTAAKEGVNLMLCGHTHGGQVWPFGYISKHYFPLFEGQYDVNGTTVIVCRGTGTWGPRMRLWRPSEILYITLHRKGK